MLQHRRCFVPESVKTQSSAPEDGRNYRPKHFELIEIINKLSLLHLVGCLYYPMWFLGNKNRSDTAKANSVQSCIVAGKLVGSLKVTLNGQKFFQLQQSLQKCHKTNKKKLLLSVITICSSFEGRQGTICTIKNDFSGIRYWHFLHTT